MCSRTLHGMHVSEIGRQFSGDHLLSFWKIAVIYAIRQSWDRMPDDRDSVKLSGKKKLEICFVILVPLSYCRYGN